MCILSDCINCGPTFQHFEAISRHQNRFGWLIKPVIGTPDPLQQPRTAFGRANIDHQVDVAPVYAEIQRRGAHDCAQFPGSHCVFNAPSLRNIERAVMQGNGKIVVVSSPQLLKQKFRLAPGIDEHQRRFVRLDTCINFTESMARRMTSPGQMLLCIEHRDNRLCAGLRDDQISARMAMQRLPNQKAAKLVRLRNSGGQAHRGKLRRQRKQTRHSKRQQVTSFRRHQ